MARLTSEITFTGSLGNLSAYKMRGSDKIIVRKKGGPSKEKIKNSPSFDLTRRYGSEFGGRSKMASKIIHKLWSLKTVNDYSLLGPLNKLLKGSQAMDAINVLGKSNILLSKNPAILEGFPLNRSTTFESVVRAPITFTLSRETMEVTIEIPELKTDINFFPNVRYAAFRVVVIAAVIPDFYFTEGVGYRPRPYANEDSNEMLSDWHVVRKGAPPTSVTLSLKTKPGEEDFTLLLAVGIVYGNYVAASEIEAVKWVGCGKIVAAR